MARHPELSLMIDVEKDIENALNFLKYREGNSWFLERFFGGEARHLMESALAGDEREAAVRKYVEGYFVEHGSEMRSGLESAKTDWKKVEDEYFRLVDVLFKDRPWPEGDYRGIVTIFGVYPRWVEEKIFFFPYAHRKPGYANRVIGHEMLHFMFFDYIRERYGLDGKSKMKGKDADHVWKVSEAFNVVIEEWAPYRDALGTDGSKPYPGQEEMFAEMSRQWAECQDVDALLDAWLK